MAKGLGPKDDGEEVEKQERKTGDGKDTELLHKEFHERVEQLPEEERTVFDLLFYQGLTHPGVAHALGVSESTVKRRWYDAGHPAQVNDKRNAFILISRLDPDTPGRQDHSKTGRRVILPVHQRYQVEAP